MSKGHPRVTSIFAFVAAVIALIFMDRALDTVHENPGDDDIAVLKKIESSRKQFWISPVNLKKGVSADSKFMTKEAGASPEVTVASVLKFISENNVCALERLMKDGKGHLPVIARVLEELPGYHSLDDDERAILQSHVSVDPKEVRAVFLGTRSDLMDFHEALLVSGQYEDVTPEVLDFTLARDLLERLARKNPQNAAYPYFLLAVEKQLGVPDSDLEGYVKQVLNAPVFDSFENQISREILQSNLNTSSEFLVGLMFLSRYRIPRYLEPQRIMRSVLDLHPELAPGFIDFGRRIMKQEERRAVGPEFITFSALRFMVARMIGKLGWQTQYKTNRFPADLNQDYRSLVKPDNTWISTALENSDDRRLCDPNRHEKNLMRLKTQLSVYQKQFN